MTQDQIIIFAVAIALVLGFRILARRIGLSNRLARVILYSAFGVALLIALGLNLTGRVTIDQALSQARAAHPAGGR